MLHDKSRLHVARSVKDFLQANRVQTVKQSPYNPDFNLVDRRIFSLFEFHRKNKTFSHTEEILYHFSHMVEEMDLLPEIDKFKEDLKAVIRKNGDYL